MAAIHATEEILAAMQYIRDHCDKIGRKDYPETICSGTFSMNGSNWSAQEAIDYGLVSRVIQKQTELS